ncbi:MAG TPA: T9SS type A sorting domain-containing protein [Puia sp.]
MNKFTFSALIFCGLLAAAPTQGQSIGDFNTPVMVSQGDHSGFTAYPQNNMVVMRWQSGSETNVDHFLIGHSTDSIHFTPLHELVSRTAIDRDSSYQDEDSYPAGGLNYYRLTVVDKDGNAFSYPIVRVDLSEKNRLTLNPSVVTMGATVRLDAYHEQPLTINIFSESGKLTGSYLVNSTSFNINTSGWSKGMYIYRISDPLHPLLDAGKLIVL